MFAGVARVEKEDAAHDLAKSFVRVAEHENIRPLAPDALPQLVARLARFDDVVDQNLAAAQFDHFRFLERQQLVGIPRHGGDRGDLLELMSDPGRADVARVNDVLDAVEELRNFRVEEIVGIRDDADFHGRREM